MNTPDNSLNPTRGFLALFSTAVIFGAFGILIRELAKMFSDPGQVFARSLSALVIITVIVIFKRYNPFKLERKHLLYLLAFSTVFSLSLLSFTISANSIKVSNSLFMLYVGSLTSTAFFGKVLFKETFSLRHLLALALVFVGLSFFVYPFSFESFSVGIVAGIAAGFLEGASHTLRKLMKDVKREVVVFYQSLSGVVLASGVLLFSNQVFVKELHLSSIVAAVIFGFLLVAIGYLLIFGFTNLDVNWGALILSTELFFALVMNALVLKEYPTQFELIGGSLIFLGTAVTTLQLKDLQQWKLLFKPAKA